MRLRLASISFLLVLAAGPERSQAKDGPAVAAAPAAGVTVELDLVVEDSQGRPVSDLQLEELDVVQENEKQPVLRFAAGTRPGSYALSYIPRSGRAGAVAVRVIRRGAKVRGPHGDYLEPRVIRQLAPLEAELAAVLDARPVAGDLWCRVGLLRFEPSPKGVRHTVAVEIAVGELLRFERGPATEQGRLQILVRIKNVDAVAWQHITFDRLVERTSAADILVWTGSSVLPPGRHTIETLVRDRLDDRATTRTFSVEVPPAAEGLRLSSVALLAPRGPFFVREEEQGDPLVYQGTPLMPTLQVTQPPGVEGYLHFYVGLYPDPANPEPIALRAELYREGAKVGETAIALPPPEPNGEIRYVGSLATKAFRPAKYVWRLVARQGASTAAEEAPFSIAPMPENPLRRPALDGRILLRLP